MGAGDICIYRQNRPFPMIFSWGFIGNGRNVSICEQAWAWPGIILDGDLARVGRGAGGLVAEGWGKPGWTVTWLGLAGAQIGQGSDWSGRELACG